MTSTLTPRTTRLAFTLLEMTFSLTIVSLLMLGLLSSIELVLRATQLSDSPSSATSQLARESESLAADIRLAQTFRERSEKAIEFTVPDRDGDQQAETIRYEWLDSTTGQLRRTLISSQSPDLPQITVLAEGLDDFSFSYLLATYGPAETEQEVESDEVLLMVQDDRPDDFGTKVLLVVVDGDSLHSEEATKRSWMEDWGFIVEPISASVTATEFEEATARNDVIYVSETVLSSTLGTKATAATIGLVCEESHLTDELGMVSGLGNASTREYLDSNVGTHFLTEGWLPGETIQIGHIGQSVRNLPSDPSQLAAGLRVLGSREGQPALAVLRQGDELIRPSGDAVRTAGETTVFDNLTDYWDFNDSTAATQFTLEDHADLLQIHASMRVQASRVVRFGLYSDNNGEPGTLLAQAEPFQSAYGVDRWVSASFREPQRLEPGTYWLAIGLDVGVQMRFENTGGRSRMSNVSPHGGLMTQWSGTLQTGGEAARVSVCVSYRKVHRSAGRRVMLPWGANGFQINQLTDAGRELMRRSLQWAADLRPSDHGFEAVVSSSQWNSQTFVPTLPRNATGWRLTRLFCRLKRYAPETYGEIRFRLLSADSNHSPSSYLFGETYGIHSANLSAEAYQWYEIPLAATGELRTDRGVCITLESTSGSPQMWVNYDLENAVNLGGTQRLESLNQGASWMPSGAGHDLRFYLYGSYRTRGEPQW